MKNLLRKNMHGIKRDVLIFPFIFSILVNAFDLYFSWYAINYLDIRLAEANPLIATSEGKVDMAQAHIAKLAIILVVALFIYVAWRTREAGFEKFERIGLISGINNTHRFFFSLVLGCNSVIFFIAFIWNPLVFASAILDLQMAHLDRLIPSIFDLSQFESQFILYFVSGIFIATYWERSFLWRYLTDEAKKRHRWLQWPYRIGFMKDEIV